MSDTSLTSNLERMVPSELLCDIFQSYTRYSPRDDLYRLGWTKLLLVCRRWHDVGIYHGRLWAFIECRLFTTESPSRILGVDQLKLMARRIDTQLLRSSNCPLSIVFDVPPVSVFEIGNTRHLELERFGGRFWGSRPLQYLVLRGNNRDVQRVMDDMSRDDHPQLQHLNVFSGLAAVPKTAILPGNMPVLEILRLINHRPNLGSIHGLRVLVLNMDFEFEDFSSMPKTELLGVLDRCPLLEELHISGLNYMHEDELPSRPAKLLPYLSSLEIAARSSISVTHILDTIGIIPPSARIILWVMLRNIDDDGSAVDALQDIEARLVAHARAGPAIRMISIVGRAEGGASVVARAQTNYRDRALPRGRLMQKRDTRSGPGFIELRCPELEEAEHLRAYLNSLPLQAVTHIDARLTPVVDDYLRGAITLNCWRSVLTTQTLPALTTLILPISRSEPGTKDQVAEILFALFDRERERGRNSVSHIVLDVASSGSVDVNTSFNGMRMAEKNRNAFRLTAPLDGYCDQRFFLQDPVDVVEIINDDANLLLDQLRRKLCSKLVIGLVHNMKLYRSEAGDEVGQPWPQA